MRRIALVLTAASALTASGIVGNSANAAPLGAPDAMRSAIGSVDGIQNVQVFVWSGRRYCWYDDGWHGPGFYWCGYAWRHGLGWGGGHGWHGWTVRGHREFGRHEEFEHRGRREFHEREFDRRGGREFRDRDFHERGMREHRGEGDRFRSGSNEGGKSFSGGMGSSGRPSGSGSTMTHSPSGGSGVGSAAGGGGGAKGPGGGNDRH